MKINYTNYEGKRTAITLSDAIVDTWAAAQTDLETKDQLIEALKAAIEATQPTDNQTFVSVVESHLLADVRDRLASLEIEAYRAQEARAALSM